MSHIKVLLVEDAPETILILQSVLELKDFKWVLARNSREATELLHKHCPHILIVDISLGPEDNGLDWLSGVRQGPFKHVHAIVMTSSHFKEDVQQSISLKVDDYILKPADHVSLTKKLQVISKKLGEHPSYEWQATAGGQELDAQIQWQGRIQALSETGLCLSSGMSNFAPITLSNFKSDLFTEMEVPPPQRITLMNYDRQINAKGYPYRNYALVQGWQEKELQKLRRWLRSNHLSRSF